MNIVLDEKNITDFYLWNLAKILKSQSLFEISIPVHTSSIR